jgi:hypothetical protein
MFLVASLKIFFHNSGLRDTAHRLTVRMLTVLRCSVTMNETSAVSGTNKALMELPYSYFVNCRFLDSTFTIITECN